MSKAKEISQGYANLLLSKLGLSSKHNEKIFKARREVCNACEHRDEEFDRCRKCGCPLAAKTKSLITECPIKLW
jgi:rRNA maturation endonuclease Nob1